METIENIQEYIGNLPPLKQLYNEINPDHHELIHYNNLNVSYNPKNILKLRIQNNIHQFPFTNLIHLDCSFPG